MKKVVTLAQFNQFDLPDATEFLMNICHSVVWANHLADARPYETLSDFKVEAKSVWRQSREADKLEAFSGHARIGDIDAILEKFAAASEQGQVLHSSDAVIKALADYNIKYEKKFGFIFIVCASGLSAEVMLEKLQERIVNTRADELANASQEQWKIMSLRIEQKIKGNEKDGDI